MGECLKRWTVRLWRLWEAGLGVSRKCATTEQQHGMNSPSSSQCSVWVKPWHTHAAASHRNT